MILLAASAAAAPNSKLPIKIKADSVEVDEQQGSSIYKGNVSITQGDMRMHADKLTVRIIAGRVNSLLAEGRPVSLKRDTPQKTRARAQRMEYLATEGKVKISGDAQLWQGVRELSGNRFVYMIDKDHISAEGGDKQQVTVILHQPESEGQKPPPQKDKNKPKPEKPAPGKK